MLLLEEANVYQADLTVVIPNHNYHKYLEEAIISAQQQSISPKRILVVDDASTGPEAQHIATKLQIDYIKVKHRDLAATRHTGYTYCDTEYIIYLDADDLLSYNYIAEGLKAIQHQNCEIAFSDLQYFGARQELIQFHPALPPRRLWQTNFIHAGSLFRRQAAKDAHRQSTRPHLEDWAFWRRLITAGYSYTKQAGIYLARIHDQNQSTKLKQRYGYCELRNVAEATLTVVISNPKFPLTVKHDGLIHYIIVNPTKRQRQLAAAVDKPLTFIYSSSKLDLLHRLYVNTDYVYFCQGEVNQSVLETLLSKLDHNVACVHWSARHFLDATLFVGPVLSHYHYYDNNLAQAMTTAFGDSEKIVYC